MKSGWELGGRCCPERGGMDFCGFGWMGRPFVDERSHLSREIFGQRRHPCLMNWTLVGRRSAASVVEVEDRRMKAGEVAEAVPGQKMALGLSRTSDRFGLGGELLADQYHFDCSRLRLTGNAALHIRLGT